MKNREKNQLGIEPIDSKHIYQEIDPEKAGWELLNFGARRMTKGEAWKSKTGSNEFVIIILGGTCTINSTKGSWSKIGKREDVFKGKPYAVYFSRETDFSVIAEDDKLDIAYGWCSTDEDHPAKLIRPEDCAVEIRGGGNATRQITSIVPPGFDCQRLVAVEVYTPSGNWSSYPPHKHDEHVEKDGKLLEADLEEIYFYKFDKPAGYAIQHVYTADKELNELVVAHEDEVVLVPAGYHPVVAAPGYNAYYLNFLAGSAQSLNATDDPDHKWVKDNWPDKDPRLPMVY